MGYAGPAVASSKVYLLDRITPNGKINREGTERVLCLDEKTGKQLWKHEYPCEYRIDYPAGPRCTPTVDGERVYCLGGMGDLFCLDSAKGNVIWSKDFPRDYGAKVPVWGYAAHPLIDGDKLICLGGGPGKLVVAFDKKTGKELWAVESCPGDFGYSPPMIYSFRRQAAAHHLALTSRARAGTRNRQANLEGGLPGERGADGTHATESRQGRPIRHVVLQRFDAAAGRGKQGRGGLEEQGEG